MNQVYNVTSTSVFYAELFSSETPVSATQAEAAQSLLSLFPDTFGAGLGAPAPTPSLGRFPSYLPPPPGYNAGALAQAFETLRGCPCHHHRHHRPEEMGPSLYGVIMSLQMLFIGSASPAKASELQSGQQPDKFAVHEACRTGKDNPSNLNNADHIKLAIYSELNRSSDSRGAYKALSAEELSKRLEEDYGIKSEVTTVKSKEGDELKALKFQNGQVFCDGAGDGKLDTGDYNFKGAIDDIKQRYGLDDAGLEKVDQAMRDAATQQRDFLSTLESMPGFQALPADIKPTYARMLSGGLFDGDGAERAFQQAAGSLGVRQEGPLGGGSYQYALVLMLQAYRIAN